MADENVQRCTVKGSIITGPPEKSLVRADGICTAGANSPEVQASPIASAALDDLQAAVQTAHKLLSDRAMLAIALAAARKALAIGMLDVKKKAQIYGTAVDAIAHGNGAVIAVAGLETRAMKVPPAALQPVSEVFFKPGRYPGQAILSWPESAGAGSYEVEVNFTPENLDGPFTALTAAANLSRVVDAPAPRAKFLARVCAVGHDGTKSAWSPSVLVTAA